MRPGEKADRMQLGVEIGMPAVDDVTAAYQDPVTRSGAVEAGLESGEPPMPHDRAGRARCVPDGAV